MATCSIPEVSESLGVSSDTVKVWIQRGELRAINVSLNRQSRKPRLRIRECDLEAFLSSRETGKPEQKPARRKRLDIPRYV